MLYRICGGIFFLLMAISLLGFGAVPNLVTGVFALLAGIGLLAGI